MVFSLSMIGRIEIGFAILCPVAAMRSIGSGARTLPLDPQMPLRAAAIGTKSGEDEVPNRLDYGRKGESSPFVDPAFIGIADGVDMIEKCEQSAAGAGSSRWRMIGSAPARR
jgi:hypothetical protein